MLQLDIIPRTTTRFGVDSWHVPDWLSVPQQNDLLTCLRAWCKGGWYQPTVGTAKLKHPIACIGYEWVPYYYKAARIKFPLPLQLMCEQAIADVGLKQYLSGPYRFKGDTGIVNLFNNPDASPALGMHQDRSEDDELINAGSPIITISLGDSCIFRFGNPYDAAAPYQDIEMRSGDLLIMAGRERSAYHGVMKIISDTTPPELEMTAKGRISLTMRQAFLHQPNWSQSS